MVGGIRDEIEGERTGFLVGADDMDSRIEITDTITEECEFGAEASPELERHELERLAGL